LAILSDCLLKDGNPALLNKIKINKNKNKTLEDESNLYPNLTNENMLSLGLWVASHNQSPTSVS
jgi:hypothetical protein